MQSKAAAYQQPRSNAWTRIDMLNELYGAATEETRKVAEDIEANPNATMTHRVRAIALVNAIESGLDLDQGELPQRIQQLCQFVEASLVAGRRGSNQSIRNDPPKPQGWLSADRSRCEEVGAGGGNPTARCP